MVMLGINKIEMSHFIGRLNASIDNVTFDKDANVDPKWSGYAILEHYLNESIFMTGSNCSDYAKKVECNENIIKNILDTWGYLDRDIKMKILKPNFEIAYTDKLSLEKISDCITITFPNVNMEIKAGATHRESIETLADIILKAGIKSISENKPAQSFAIHIYRVNTNYLGFQKQGYADIPNINPKDINNLIEEANNNSKDNPFFIYFYRDKFDSHYTNIDNYD